jgi:hypothetical protein
LLSILKNEQLFQFRMHEPRSYWFGLAASIARRRARWFPLTPGFSRVLVECPRKFNRFNGLHSCVLGTTGLKPGLNEIFISRGVNRAGLRNYPVGRGD